MTGDWKTASAAVAGPNKGALGCQDAVALRRLRAGDRSALVIALADGAGSAVHGGDAARLIVALLCQFAATRLRRRLRAGKSPALNTADLEIAFARARGAVTRAAEAQQHDLRDWGSTALLAVLLDDATIIAQVGDGAVCLRIDGQWSCPLPPDLDGYVNVTAFLTHAHAPPRTHAGPRADAALLFSDGLQPLALDYKKAEPHEPFCQGVIAELGKSADPRKLERDLAAWLASDAIRARTDDDISLAMALRT